jgi:hypothetical protein
MNKQVERAKSILETEYMRDVCNEAALTTQRKRDKIYRILDDIAPTAPYVNEKLKKLITETFILDTRKTDYDLGFVLCVYMSNKWNIFLTNRTLDVIKLEDL